MLGAASDLRDEFSEIHSPADASIFRQGIVTEILCDVSIIGDATELFFESLKARLADPVALEQAPRDCLVVQFGEIEKEVLCYPFFPPHMIMPIKQGERVWVLRQPGRMPFWMCRVPSNQHVDDINYTHDDRRWDFSIGDYLSVATDITKAAPDFPNGPEGYEVGLEENPTLGNIDRTTGLEYDAPPFERIFTGSMAAGSVVVEPVPRFTRRPGDMVLQGSNNTLICLGQDRGWGVYDADPNPMDAAQLSSSSTVQGDELEIVAGADPKVSDGEYKNILKELAGAIDLVAGRGRIYLNSSGEPLFEDLNNADPTRTEPRVILNTRSLYETDKNPTVSKLGANPLNRLCDTTEGDPDFIYDASRIYISMRTDVDADYGLIDFYPAPFEAEIPEMIDTACIVAKSDEIRIIARKKEKDKPYKGAPEINGSIRIVKEGDPSDDAAAIVLLPDGTIQISGSKIFLGRHADNEGAGNGPGPGDSQPYVKYQELEDLLKAIMEDIKSFATSLQTTFSSNTTPGFGSPSPTLVTAAAAECTTLQTDMTARINDIPTIKSDRIFGE
jgi:hypothetical protein